MGVFLGQITNKGFCSIATDLVVEQPDANFGGVSDFKPIYPSGPTRFAIRS